MASRRTLIRKAFVQVLKDANTLAGKRIFSNLATPIWEDLPRKEFPAICVYLSSEEIEIQNTAPKELKNKITMRVEIKNAGPDQEDAEEDGVPSIDEELESLVDQVEAAIFLADSGCDPNDKAVTKLKANGDAELLNVEYEYEGDGAVPIGSARMVFTIDSFRFLPIKAELQNVTPFEQANVKWHIGHDNSDPDLTETEAEDEILVPQP